MSSSRPKTNLKRSARLPVTLPTDTNRAILNQEFDRKFGEFQKKRSFSCSVGGGNPSRIGSRLDQRNELILSFIQIERWPFLQASLVSLILFWSEELFVV